MNLLPVAAINLVSGVLAAVGLFGALSMTATRGWVGEAILAVAPQTPVEAVFAIFCVVLSALLQALINWGWGNAWRHGLLRSPAHLFVGAAMSVASGLCSAATVALAFSSDSLDWHKRQEAVAPLVARLVEAADAVQGWSEGMMALSAESRRLAEVEAAVGGTCRDDTSPAGSCGPRCRFRKTQAERLAGNATALQALTNRFAGVAVEAQTAARAKVPDVYREAVLLGRSAELSGLRASLWESRRELEDGFVDPEIGQRFTCASPDLLGQVKALEARIGGGIVLPAEVPRVERAALSDSLAALFRGLAGAVLGGEKAAPVGLWPLAIAFGVEFVQIMLLRNRERSLIERGRIREPWEEFTDGALVLDNHDAERTRHTLLLLGGLTIPAGELGDFFAVPFDGTPEKRQEAMEVVDFFGLERFRRGGTRAPLAQIDPGWVASRERWHGGAKEFDLYPLDRRVARWRRRAARDLARHAKSAA